MIKKTREVVLVLMAVVLFGISSEVTSADSHSFISKWDTTKLRSNGDTNNHRVALPLTSSGTYNFTVQWGDGTSDVITSYNQAEIDHDYASKGTYTIVVDGTIDGIQFGLNGRDNFKIVEISQWGNLRLGNSGFYFYGTKNLNIVATDILDLTGTANLTAAFASSSISTVPNMNNWNVSNVTNMSSMFQGASSFNQDISGWNVSNVASMYWMFQGATSFNQPIGSWNVSNVTNMEFMFNDSSFNQPLGSWNVSNVSKMHGMFMRAGLSTKNYNNLLVSWAKLPALQRGVYFSAENVKYDLGEPAIARGKLINDYNWVISDGGGHPIYEINMSKATFNTAEDIVINWTPAITDLKKHRLVIVGAGREEELGISGTSQNITSLQPGDYQVYIKLNNQGVLISNTLNFTVVKAPIPNPVSINPLGRDKFSNNQNVVIDWPASQYATSYEVTSDLHSVGIPSIGFFLYLPPFSNVDEGTSYSENFQNIGDHWLSVRACNSTGCSPFSKSVSFDVFKETVMEKRQREWFETAPGRKMNLDDKFGFQCVDVADDYSQNIFNLPYAVTIGLGNAGQLYDIANPNYFTKYPNNPNDPDQIPKHGDIIVWTGHIAVVDSATKDSLTVIQQNRATKTNPYPANLSYGMDPAERYPASYNISELIGWLRPREQD